MAKHTIDKKEELLTQIALLESYIIQLETTIKNLEEEFDEYKKILELFEEQLKSFNNDNAPAELKKNIELLKTKLEKIENQIKYAKLLIVKNKNLLENLKKELQELKELDNPHTM